MASFAGDTLRAAVRDLLESKIVYDEEAFHEALYDYGSTTALAAAIAGTKDKKSNAYRSALRKVDFYKQGIRKPSKKSADQIVAVLKANRKSRRRRIHQINGLHVTIMGTWYKSKDKRFRKIECKLDTFAAKRFLRETLNSEARGMDFFLLEYGVDDAFFENYSIIIEEI